MNWISVEDKLPEDHEHVFVYLGEDKIATAGHLRKGIWWDRHCWITFPDVTHWCYIEKPEEI